MVRFYCLVRVKLCEQVYLHEKKKMETTFSALLKPPFFHLIPLIVTVRTLSDYYSKHRCLFVSEDFRTFLNPNLSLCNEYAAPPHRLCARRGLFCVRLRRCRVRVVSRGEEDQTGLKRKCSSLIRGPEVMRRRLPALKGSDRPVWSVGRFSLPVRALASSVSG